MSGFQILALCSIVFLAVIVLDAVRSRQFKRFLFPFLTWLAVTAFALFYLQKTTGRVSFGFDASHVWAVGAILFGAILGIAARYIFYLGQANKSTWLDLLKPLCISPIVVLPLVASMQREGAIETYQIIMFWLLAFQNGFFWQVILVRAEAHVRAS